MENTQLCPNWITPNCSAPPPASESIHAAGIHNSAVDKNMRKCHYLRTNMVPPTSQDGSINCN
jgi:hypothetical protein